MENQGGNSGGSSVLRDYRKGNWTVQETMVLIEAKKMDEERRMKRNVIIGESSSDHQQQIISRNKPAELRWKWVEDYCWRNGCFRSQNQCNDKWDNLMRDFKKVRDYERKLALEGNVDNNNNKSYWKIEKSERKERNLPSNMLFGIYEALVEVVERKCFRVVGGGASGGGGGGVSLTNYNITPHTTTTTSVQLLPTLPPLVQQPHPISSPTPITILPLPPPQSSRPLPSPPPPQQLPYALPCSQPLPTVDSSETSEYSDSPAKRRRRRKRGKGEQAGTSSTTGNASGTSTDFASAFCKSASIIAEALQSNGEKEERRHKELLSLNERRLQIEESKAEINRQGINGLVHAINNLSNSILALATKKNNPNP